jgi:hypothetical protein
MAGRDYNINVRWFGQGSRQAFGGGNLAKMNNGLNTENNKNITTANLKGYASLGMAIKVTQQINESLGSYTENRLRQRKMQVGIRFGKYAIGMMLNPALGALYAGVDLGYKTLNYQIQIGKQNREADYYKRLSGNNTNSGSRYRGSYS